MTPTSLQILARFFHASALSALLAMHAFAVASDVLVQNSATAAFADAAAAISDNTAACAQAVDASLSRYLKPANPGATVIVTKNGRILFRKAYGMADLSQGQALQADMSLRVGSVTKQFTAAAIMLLAEEGKLAVTDDIVMYLPDYPTRGQHITIEHLLAHTSGIRNYTALPQFVHKANSPVSITQAIDFFKDAVPEFTPGERFSYSNSNYFLLGAIIEKVSGMPYAEFMQQRVFKPLQLQHTFIETDAGKPVIPVITASGYSHTRKGDEAAPQYSMSWPYAAGALRTSVDDLAVWNQAIVEGRLLKAESWKKMSTPYVFKNGRSSPYGYGFFIRKIHGKDAIEHGGDIPGFSAGTLRLPGDGLYVAVLGNSDSLIVAPGVLVETIADIVSRYSF